MGFKIAYCAGHYIGTAGKRLPKELDKNETREWVLNDRIADHFAKAAAEYEGVELLRTDDPTGKKFIDIPERTAKANAWGADLYVDMHHNAAGKIFSGGGVVVYCHPNSSKGKEYQVATYNAIIKAGGLKGNRSDPLLEKKFDSLTMTKMPAILMEYGFMDSKVDAPVILTDAYSKLVAYATMEGIAKVAELKKKAPTVTQETAGKGEQIYRVRTSWDNPSSQTGAYKGLENAKNACPVGYSIYDKDGKAVYTNKQASASVDGAQSFNSAKAGTYVVTATILNLRSGASTNKQIIEEMPKGSNVRCYGYYTGSWLYVVSDTGKTGFCHESYLKKK